ncbi:MAG: hypothetical protein ACPHUL_00855 [Marinomonas gallaica]
MQNNPIKPNTKIRILSPEHSEYVQKLAFEAGFRWFDGAETKALDKPFLFFSSEKVITFTNCDLTFEDKLFEEIHIPLPEIPKETIDALYFNHGVPKIDSVILGEKLDSDFVDLEKWAKDSEEIGRQREAEAAQKSNGSKHSHYFKDVSDLDEIDVYRVCDLFDVNDTSGAIQHALKKLLCSGQRGVKDYRKDLEEARDSIQRKLDIMAEDGE